MKSIKLRFVLLNILLVFIVMVVSGTVMIVQVRNTEIETTKSELNKAVDITIENIIQKSTDNSDLQKLIDEGYNENFKDLSINIYIYIFTKEGLYLASSTADTEFQPGNVIIPSMNRLPNYSVGRQGLDKDGWQKKWIEYSYPFVEGDKFEYIIFVRTDMDKIIDNQSVIAYTFVMASSVALLLTAIVGYLLADTFTKPILRLTKKSKELAEGNLYQQIKVSSKDEIGQLTSTFNYMATELSNTILTIDNEKRKLEVLLSNMTDGVLAFDFENNLLHANELAYELLELDPDKQLNLDTLLEVFSIDQSQLDDFEDNYIKEFSVNIGDKFINAVFSVYISHDKRSFIAVLRDFTKFKKLDNMRKEFVANVSHEIRTPLTTIKGYAETLLDGAIEDLDMSMNFLNVINSEADRMTLLVKDLLELSRFDNQQLKIELVDVDLIGVIKETIIQNKLSADKKDQTIIFLPQIDNANIKADRGRVIQVISNIISNSIKYSVEKGTITIEIDQDNDFYIVYIKDCGIGIPKEDLEHVFERFFRVDKARSRAMGGTGLGLAIAKEIMEAHQGKIYANSELGVGTTIILEFNKNLSDLKDEE